MDSAERVWRERGLRSAVLAGDERAWRLWYDESFAGLYAYVLWRCAGLRDLADEIVQDVWLTAVRRMRSFDPQTGPFAGWLCGIAANLLRNHFRRTVRRGVPASLNGHHDVLAAPPPDTRRDDTARRTAKALAALPEHYEAVLRAKYLEQQSVDAIASSRGDSAKAVESLLTRARRAFRDAYAQLENQHE